MRFLRKKGKIRTQATKLQGQRGVYCDKGKKPGVIKEEERHGVILGLLAKEGFMEASTQGE